MIFKGDQNVVGAIQEKKRLLNAGESHEHIRPVLFIAGGVMRGVYGGGAVTALHELGYTNVFDHVIGVSTGAPTAAYFLGGNPRKGTSIYYEECCNEHFLQALWRSNWLRKARKTIAEPISISYLDKVFRGSTGKPVDCDAVFANRTEFHIAVTVGERGDAWYVNTCDCEVLHNGVAGSCLIPGVGGGVFHVNDEEVIDGVVGGAFPIKLLRKIDPTPTHILVIANRAEHSKLSWRQRWFEYILFNIFLSRKLSHDIRAKVLQRSAMFDELMREFNEEFIGSSATVWGDGSVKALTLDPEKLKRTAQRSEQWWRELLTTKV